MKFISKVGSKVGTKLLLSAAMMVGGSAALTGCYAGDVYVGTGYGGGVVYDPYYYGPGYYGPGYYGGTYWGGGYWRGGHWGGGHWGGGHWGGRRLYAAQIGESTSVAETDPAQEFATDFKMPVESSRAFKAALDQAANGQAAALNQLGFTDTDARAMASGQAISEASVQTIAQNLKQSPTDTKAMLTYMQSEVLRQSRDVDSPLWQQCIATKNWRTPENGQCSETFWKGCSPSTGASFCLINR